MRKLFTWVGFTTVLSAILTFTHMPNAVAEDLFAPNIAVLDRPGEPAWVEIGGSTAIASYNEVDGAFVLTTLLRRGAEGEVLRGRVLLSDGQGHQMILNSEDGSTRDRFTFRRAGAKVLITGTALGTTALKTTALDTHRSRLTAANDQLAQR